MDQARTLRLVFGLQAVCAAFFLYDSIADLLGYEGGPWGDTDAFEYIVTAALVVSLVVTWRWLRAILARNKRMSDQLKAASGAFAQLMEEHFEAWGLTPSERDVALLSIKGLSIAEMAALRDSKEGTIKSQCNALYRKAGVSGRPQLLSLFIEELLAGELAARTRAPAE